MSPWLDRATPFALTVQISNTTEIAIDRISVRIAVHSPVGSRSELRQALDGDPRGGQVVSTSEPVDGSLAPGEQRTVTVTRDLSQFGGAFSRTGVYPVSITVRHSAGEQSAYSALPFMGSTPQARINVAWVMPVARPAAPAPDGVYARDDIDGLRLDELAQQLAVIGARTGIAVTLAPNAALLDTLADLADGFAVRGGSGVEVVPADAPDAQRAAAALQAARAAARAAGEVASTPYALADLSSLAHHGLRGDLVRQLTLGRSVVEARLGRAPVSSTLVPTRFTLDAAAVAAMAPLGVSGMILDPALFGDVPPSDVRPDLFGPSQPVAVRTGGGFNALLPDAALTERLSTAEQGVLLAQAVIAETASAWLELPGLAAQRVLTIASNRLPSPTTIAAALDGLARAPWARLQTAGSVMATLRPDGDAVAIPRKAPPRRAFLLEARRARRALQTVGQIVLGDLPEIDAVNRLILVSESFQWETAGKEGERLARAAAARARRILNNVKVFSRPVTLTARTGSVPVTILNANEFPVRIRVHLESAKVGFPRGATRTIEIDERTVNVDFAVEARAAGSYPMTVRVETPDGSRLIARGTLSLRSTTVSAVALGAVGGSVVFLIWGWLRRGSRRKKTAASG